MNKQENVMNPEPVGIAVTGLGRWANVLTGALVKSERLALRACNSRDAAKRQAFADKFGCEQNESYDALLARDDVEAVLITTSDDTHAEYALKAAEAGKHVIVEKPMAHSVAACRTMIDACAKAGVTLAVAHGHRHSHAMRHMKQMIADGELGAPTMAMGKFTIHEGQKITPQHWRYYRAANPAGPLHPLGVHIVDNFNFLLGAPQRVFAAFRKPLGRAEIDDTVHVIIEYPNQVLATLVSSFINPRSYGVHLFGAEANAVFTCASSSEDFDDTTTMLVQGKRGAAVPVEFPAGNILLSELEDFADAIRHERAPACDGEQGLRAVAVLEAAVRSNEQEAWVDITEA